MIEQTPVRDLSGEQRGVVAEGAVGARWAGRFRIFRYEIRVWRGGHIPDVAEAVDSPRRLTSEASRPARARSRSRGADPGLGSRRVRHGRDVELELRDRVGDRAQRHRRRVDPAAAGGRAPGWQAGVVVASRTEAEGTAAANPERPTVDP